MSRAKLVEIWHLMGSSYARFNAAICQFGGIANIPFYVRATG